MTGIIRPTSPRNEVFFEGMTIAFALTTVVGFAQADIREFRPRVSVSAALEKANRESQELALIRTPIPGTATANSGFRLPVEYQRNGRGVFVHLCVDEELRTVR
jgi:hypothetical protein